MRPQFLNRFSAPRFSVLRSSSLRYPSILLIVALASGCTRDPKPVTTTTSDSSYSSTTPQKPVADDGLQLPAVPDIPVKTDSNAQAAQQLPESDSMDVRTKVTLKSIANSETVARGVQLYVVGVDRQDSLTLLHIMLQNLWGATTKVHPQPISVKLTEDQLAHAKLLDDQTGKASMSNAESAKGKATITTSADWKLKPGETKSITLAFGPLSRGSHTATMIIPGFATVTRISLNP